MSNEVPTVTLVTPRGGKVEVLGYPRGAFSPSSPARFVSYLAATPGATWEVRCYGRWHYVCAPCVHPHVSKGMADGALRMECPDCGAVCEVGWH